MLMEQAIVTAVNVQEYSVDVLTEDSSRALLGVPIMNPLSHPDHPGGIVFMPEVGAKCWICTPGTSTSAFVLGFMWNSPTQEEARPYEGEGPNFTGNRAAMEPGDIMLGTVDGNAVIVRRGGIVQVGASPLAQRIYMPIGNVVRDYFQRYHGLSPLGEIEWGHAQLLPEHGTDLSKVDLPVTVRYKIKTSLKDDVSDETKPFPVELRIGVLPSDVNDTAATNAYAADLKAEKRHVFMNDEIRSRLGDTLAGNDEAYGKDAVISLVFNSTDSSNTPARKVTYAFQVGTDGDRYEFSAGHVLSESRGSHTIRAEKSIILDSDKVAIGDVLANTTEALVLGNQLKDLLDSFMQHYIEHQHTTAVGLSSPPMTFALTAAKKLQYITTAATNILSTIGFTKR